MRLEYSRICGGKRVGRKLGFFWNPLRIAQAYQPFNDAESKIIIRNYSQIHGTHETVRCMIMTLNFFQAFRYMIQKLHMIPPDA